jgi:predicted ATPase
LPGYSWLSESGGKRSARAKEKRISALKGIGGVGKTALAVKIAHRLTAPCFWPRNCLSLYADRARIPSLRARRWKTSFGSRDSWFSSSLGYRTASGTASLKRRDNAVSRAIA